MYPLALFLSSLQSRDHSMLFVLLKFYLILIVLCEVWRLKENDFGLPQNQRIHSAELVTEVKHGMWCEQTPLPGVPSCLTYTYPNLSGLGTL